MWALVVPRERLNVTCSGERTRERGERGGGADIMNVLSNFTQSQTWTDVSLLL